MRHFQLRCRCCQCAACVCFRPGLQLLPLRAACPHGTPSDRCTRQALQLRRCVERQLNLRRLLALVHQATPAAWRQRCPPATAAAQRTARTAPHWHRHRRRLLTCVRYSCTYCSARLKISLRAAADLTLDSAAADAFLAAQSSSRFRFLRTAGTQAGRHTARGGAVSGRAVDERRGAPKVAGHPVLQPAAMAARCAGLARAWRQRPSSPAGHLRAEEHAAVWGHPAGSDVQQRCMQPEPRPQPPHTQLRAGRHAPLTAFWDSGRRSHRVQVPTDALCARKGQMQAVRRFFRAGHWPGPWFAPNVRPGPPGLSVGDYLRPGCTRRSILYPQAPHRPCPRSPASTSVPVAPVGLPPHPTPSQHSENSLDVDPSAKCCAAVSDCRTGPVDEGPQGWERPLLDRGSSRTGPTHVPAAH